MTQKIRILTMVFLALTVELAMAGIGGAVAASAAPTPASLAWSPTNSRGTYDYGALATGATKSVTFTLTNAGGKASGPLRITLSGSAAFTISRNRCSGRSLGPKKSCTVPVEYAPASSGQSASVTLTATSKAASASLTLSGKAGLGGTPNLTLSPGTFVRTKNGTKVYDYNLPEVASGTQLFTVTNSGTSASETLHLYCNSSPTRASCFTPPFSLGDLCSGNSLPANGGSCKILVVYTLPNNCQSGTEYRLEVEFYGTIGSVPNSLYITLDVNVSCP